MWIGEKIESVAIHRYSVMLYMADSNRQNHIQIFSSIEMLPAISRTAIADLTGVEARALLPIIGRAISSLWWSESKDLTLQFDSLQLTVFNHHDGYEAMILKHSDSMEVINDFL